MARLGSEGVEVEHSGLNNLILSKSGGQALVLETKDGRSQLGSHQKTSWSSKVSPLRVSNIPRRRSGFFFNLDTLY